MPNIWLYTLLVVFLVVFQEISEFRCDLQVVTGRRPFGQVAEFDYEYDSDDDWEDEGEVCDRGGV